ncbi:MAG: FAD-dependent thymidylate synthase, partial [Chloroflexales bacterium]|nr:FAD-dependent thymidylate synthase [Chloroflexales bacterium]
RPAELAGTPHAAVYAAAMDGLFDTYTSLIEPTVAFVRARTPRDAQTSERAYTSATRAKALDLLRGLLPMATLTNVGLFGNGRAFEYLLTKLYAAEQHELRELAGQLQAALDALIPSFVKRAKSERGHAYQAYLKASRANVAFSPQSSALSPQPSALGVESSVVLSAYDEDAEQRVVAAVLYAHSDAPLADVRAAVETMGAEERMTLLRAYIGERASRFHKPGRALEEARYSFDILADLGAYRDLQRHRMLSQERQSYTVAHGFITPPELAEAGLAAQYQRAIEAAGAAFGQISARLPEAAQYAVPLACRVRWRITLNLRELYHFCELRAAPQGHPTYRAIAQEMYRLVAATHPRLAEGMRFVDLNEYALERLDAERRLDTKLQ